MPGESQQAEEPPEDSSEKDASVGQGTVMLASASSDRGSGTSSTTEEDEAEEKDAEESESAKQDNRSKYKSLALIYFGILVLLALSAVFLRKGTRFNEFQL